MVVPCGTRELEQRCSLADWLRIALHNVTPQRLKSKLVAMALESTCYACMCEVSIERTKLGSLITLARLSRHA